MAPKTESAKAAPAINSPAMLFTGIFCLLAGLAAASTAAVTTIIAAATETAQADAAPASGAGSAHDAAVTPIEKRNPKRVRPPNSNGIYKKRRHIHSYADKMQFAHCSAEILVFSSTGVKKGCDDLTASGLNLSQILTDVELLNPSLYKLLSMLADTDAAMRGAAAQAIIAAYKAACAVVICKPDMSVKGVRCILRTQKGIKVASKSAMQAPSAVVTISSLPHRTDGSDGGDNQQTCIPSSSRQQAPQLPGIAATSQLVCSPHAPAPHTTGIAATLQLFGSPHAIPQQQPGTTATSHLSCSPHAPTPQLAGTAVTSQLFGRPPLLPQRQPGTTATSQQVGSPHAPTPQLPGTTATSLLFGSPPLLPQRQPGTTATSQLVGSPHAPAPQLPGTTATSLLFGSPPLLPQRQPGTTATSQQVGSPHAPAPQLPGTTATSLLFGSPPLLPQRQPGTTATSQLVGSPHAPAPQLPGTTATSLLFGSPPLAPTAAAGHICHRQPGTSATAQLVGSPHAPAPQLPGTTATSLLFGSPPLLPQRQPGTSATAQLVGSPHAPAPQLPGTTATPQLCDSLQQSYVDTVETDVGVRGNQPASQPRMQPARHVLFAGLREQLGVQAAATNRPFAPAVKMKRVGKGASKKLGLLGSPHPSPGHLLMPSTKRVVARGDTTLSELAGKGLDDIEDHVERIMAGGKRELMMPLYQWLCKHLTGQQQQSSFFADLHKAVSKLPTKSLNA
ncbi:hypothetical protein QJQ45_002019 [Haematococcus lacustris]|nr:hypothetical protein QJQ45_002019 [Haematococcus lacustris]